MLHEPDKFGAVASTTIPRSTFLKQHADKMCDDGIASRVSASDLQQRATKNGCYAFAVKELKTASDGTITERLRAILAPERLNNALEESYTAQLDLQHVSRYIDDVTHEAATIGDLKISFFQIELPVYCRAWYRFADAEGNVYEYNRMPMGYKPSAEIMQMVTEVIAGCPKAIRPECGRHVVSPHVISKIDVWVDGFRGAGSAKQCRRMLDIVTSNAQFVGATFKEPPSVSKRYDFIGVDFNHDAKKVSVAKKTRKKLGDAVPRRAPISAYASLAARLIFCAGVLRLPLARYYHAFKTVNRYANRFNRDGEDFYVDLARTDNAAFVLLQEWLRESLGSKDVRARAASDPDVFDICYIDASLYGWGCYIILASGELIIHGGKWPPGTDTSSSGQMANLEARAVENTFKHCGHRFTVLRNVDLRIDNSSVAHGMRRALARTTNINERIEPALTFCRDEDINYTVKLVKSADNHADAESRGKPSESLRAVVDRVPRSRGWAGRVAARGVVLTT
jgi:hypothetical protein